MSTQFWWYVARASGIVAWLLLTASVLWGIILSTKAFPRRRRPAWLLDLHRALGALTVGFVAVHVAALIADSYVHFGIADVAVPFASSWRPTAVALGVIAGWALVAVEVTSLVMKRLSRKTWHAIHLVSYLVFWLATFHGAFAGSDRSRPLYQWTAVLSIIVVAWAMTYRLTHRKAPRAVRATPKRPATKADVDQSAEPLKTGT